MIKKYNIHQNLEEWKCNIAENGITWVKCNLKYALDTFTTWVNVLCHIPSLLLGSCYNLCSFWPYFYYLCDLWLRLSGGAGGWRLRVTDCPVECWTDLFSLTNRHAEVNHVSVHVSHRWNPEVPSKDRCKPELTQFTDPDRSLLLNQQSS